MHCSCEYSDSKENIKTLTGYNGISYTKVPIQNLCKISQLTNLSLVGDDLFFAGNKSDYSELVSEWDYRFLGFFRYNIRSRKIDKLDFPDMVCLRKFRILYSNKYAIIIGKNKIAKINKGEMKVTEEKNYFPYTFEPDNGFIINDSVTKKTYFSIDLNMNENKDKIIVDEDLRVVFKGHATIFPVVDNNYIYYSKICNNDIYFYAQEINNIANNKIYHKNKYISDNDYTSYFHFKINSDIIIYNNNMISHVFNLIDNQFSNKKKIEEKLQGKEIYLSLDDSGIYQLIMLDQHLMDYISRSGRDFRLLSDNKYYLVKYSGTNKPILLLQEQDYKINIMNICDFYQADQIAFNNEYICSSFGGSLYIVKTKEAFGKSKKILVKKNEGE